MLSAMSTKRAVVLLCAVALATLMAMLTVLTSKPAGAATDVLPDLRMARLQSLQIKKCADASGDCEFAGQRQLRFSGIIANVGAGDFELHGKRSVSGAEMNVT
jgi:hypothetical protein